MKSFFKVILLLLIPLSLLLAYALSTVEIGSGDYVLEKADLSVFDRYTSTSADVVVLPADSGSFQMPAVVADTAQSEVVVADRDSAAPVVTIDEVPSRPLKVATPDSTKFRILFFGDSMLEGLSKRMCDYTMENGYDLTSVIWYSSSTKLWAETDTLQFFLNQIRPDYVVLCLGSNELFVRDLDKRDRYIATLVNKLSGYPFVWISPPNWKDDTGINQLIIKNVGIDRYFDSRHLELERSSDHAHPTRTAAALWMDTVAVWMSSPASRHPLRMDRPQVERKRKYRQYVLKPVH